MTKVERLEERIRQDDRMCAGINEVLNRLEKPDDSDFGGEFGCARAIGWIKSCLVQAGRREVPEVSG